MTVVRVALEKVADNPFQTRSSYEGIEELAQNIHSMVESLPETSGLMQVPVARLMRAGMPFDPGIIGVEDALQHEDVTVQLAFGHRRFRAFQELAKLNNDYQTFPVDIVVLDAQSMADMAWQENKKRKDLNPIEEAEAIQRVMAEFEWSQGEVGKRWDLTQGAISNKLRLLGLPEQVKNLIRNGTVTERHGRALLVLLDIHAGVDVMLGMLKSATDGQARTVAEVEESVTAYVNGHTADLSAVKWTDDWLPNPAKSDAFANVALACKLCPHCIQVGRQRRCADRTCFQRKDLAHKVTVTGPAMAKDHYQNDGGKVTAVPEPAEWTRCYGCGRQREAFKGTEFEGQPWMKLGYVETYCPECWERAGLEPQIQQITQMGSSGAVTVASEASNVMRDSSNVKRETSAADSADSGTGLTLGVRPGIGPAPAVARVPAPQVPAPHSVPTLSSQVKPSVVLTARIKPAVNGEDLSERRVVLSIAEEGSMPRDFRSGSFGELSVLMNEMLSLYFQMELVEEA